MERLRRTIRSIRITAYYASWLISRYNLTTNIRTRFIKTLKVRINRSPQNR